MRRAITGEEWLVPPHCFDSLDAAASHARGKVSHDQVGLPVADLDLRLQNNTPIALDGTVHARNAWRAARTTRRRVEELILAGKSLTNFK